MAARIHPGAVRHLWDHHVVTLRNPAGERVALVSLYAIAASATLGPGMVAVVDVQPPDGGPVRGVVGAPAALAEGMAGRLRALGMTEAALDAVTVGRVERTGTAGDDSVEWRIELPDASVQVAWREPSPPFWLDAPAPTLLEGEDIWACFIEYGRAIVTLDGQPIDGLPFADEAWLPKVGRTLSSAHIAFGEVRVDPPG